MNQKENKVGHQILNHLIRTSVRKDTFKEKPTPKAKAKAKANPQPNTTHDTDINNNNFEFGRVRISQ